MTDSALAEQEELRAGFRRQSDEQLANARRLLDFERSGAWRENYDTFDEWVDNEMGQLPGSARDVLRVQRKLEAIDLSPDTAREIGWAKLRVVSSKLYRGNAQAVLEDLRSGTILAVRSKYCPSRPRISRGGTRALALAHPGVAHPGRAQAGVEPACHERDPRGDCGAVVAETGDAMNGAPMATAEGHTEAGTTLEREVPQEEGRGSGAGSRAALDSGTRNAETPPRVIKVDEFVAATFDIARRYTGPDSDELLLIFICAVFISTMGSASEKKCIQEGLPAELARRRAGNPQSSGSPALGGRNQTGSVADRPRQDVALDVETSAENGPAERPPPEVSARRPRLTGSAAERRAERRRRRKHRRGR